MSKFPTAAEMRAWGDEQTDPEIKAVFYRVADDFDQKGWARVADAYYLTEATTHKLETDAAIRIAEMAHMVGWEAIFEGKVTERDDKLEPIIALVPTDGDYDTKYEAVTAAMQAMKAAHPSVDVVRATPEQRHPPIFRLPEA